MLESRKDYNYPLVYLGCPPLGVERVALIQKSIKKWVLSPALSRLVVIYGSKIPKTMALKPLLSWLLDFSEHWNYRKLQQEAIAKDIREGARWLLNNTHISNSDAAAIEQSARELGLIGINEPIGKAFDIIIVLGGARLSCLLRPRLAAKLIKEAHIKPKQIFFLASSRPIADSERDATNTYAPAAENEFDLINAGAELSFPILKEFVEERYDDPLNINNSWVIRRYSDKMLLPPMITISAPSSEPDLRRANSADTYEFLFSKFDIPQASSLLIITSQIYVPYQQLEAIRTLALPRNVVVETVGYPREWAKRLQGMAGPANYLQEIRSTIQSANRFINSFTYKEKPEAKK